MSGILLRQYTAALQLVYKTLFDNSKTFAKHIRREQIPRRRAVTVIYLIESRRLCNVTRAKNMIIARRKRRVISVAEHLVKQSL